jgi:Cu/Ag efflux protein CusF
MQTPFAAITGFLALAISSLAVSPSEAQPVVAGAEDAELIQVTARVKEVDMANRLITITGPLGDTVVVKAGPQVKNLKKVKGGEDITLSYYQAVAVTVRRYDGPPMTTEQVFEKAEQQGMDLDPPTAEIDEVAIQEPGAAGVADTLTVTTTIVEVNYNNRVVTLKGAQGRHDKVRVGPDVDIEALQAGQKVTVQVTQAIAVDVKIP